MKTILITGGAGFLGSHLCDQLIENNKIICVDNFLTGKKENILHLLNHPNFKLIEHDITEPLYIDDQSIDQIYNLACPAAPLNYQINRIRTLKTNILGTINMLGLAKKHKARILQASTSEVYGNPLEHPQKETYQGNVNMIGPRSCYDEGKRCAETLMYDYMRQHKIDIKIMRIFNTYGPRMAKDDRRVVSGFILQALAGKDITVWGDGKQTRSFCYVNDLINGMIKLMNTENVIGPINIGNPNEFTIIDLAKKVIQLTKSTSKIIHLPLPKDDPVVRRPDITLAKGKLNWSPKIELEEGIKKSLPFFRNLLSN